MGKRIRKAAAISDDELIGMYWQRNETALDETNKKYGRFLFAIAYRILQDRLDCEECQNDTYRAVWKAIPPTWPVDFQAFIVQIMRRIALDRYKERSRKKRIPSDYTVSIEDLKMGLQGEEPIDESQLTGELGRLINEYVKTLPEKRRLIFTGRFYLAAPVKKIASMLSVSEATVYREIEAIKRDLKEFLEKNEVYV